MKVVVGALFAAAVLSIGCTGSPLQPAGGTPTPDTGITVWTFQIGSTCSGRLSSSIDIYVDNVYRGQPVGQQLGVTIDVGMHEYKAFTEDRRFQWGPVQKYIGSSGSLVTLDC